MCYNSINIFDAYSFKFKYFIGNKNVQIINNIDDYLDKIIR